MHIRRCTHRLPMRRQSSHPSLLGATSPIGSVALAADAGCVREGGWHETPLLPPPAEPGAAVGVRRLPLPARGDRVGGALVPALRPVVPGRGGAAGRARRRG